MTENLRCTCAAAVVNSGVPGADERLVAQVMGSIADRVCEQFVNPYIFPSFHERILSPYNYYQFGQACDTPSCLCWGYARLLCRSVS
jgi:hypothetical protein